MYNRILNRPMFKLGGDTADAQGSGITSGLDTPRRGLVTGPGGYAGTVLNPLPERKPPVPFEAKIRTAMNKLKVDPADYRQATWEGVAGGFGDPSTKTLSEAVWKSNMMRKEGIKPLEASVAERKFELSKLPFERTMAMDVAKSGIAETATQTRAQHLKIAINLAKGWEKTNPGEPMPFNLQQEYEGEMSLATQGKVTTMSEAQTAAMEIHMGNGETNFAKQYRMAVLLKDKDPEMQILYDQLMDMLDSTSKIILGWSLKRQEEATGGRVGYQFGVGPNVMEEQVTDTFKMPGETIQATEQVEKVLPTNGSMGDIPMPSQDPYMLLRARLPQEITDDVVRLIAYNPEAFADFAAIESQEDVVLFNQKYGVELVLPTEQA